MNQIGGNHERKHSFGSSSWNGFKCFSLMHSTHMLDPATNEDASVSSYDVQLYPTFLNRYENTVVLIWCTSCGLLTFVTVQHIFFRWVWWEKYQHLLCSFVAAVGGLRDAQWYITSAPSLSHNLMAIHNGEWVLGLNSGLYLHVTAASTYTSACMDRCKCSKWTNWEGQG